MNKFVVIDLETTGQSPEIGDKIIEIGLVIIENNKIVDEYSTFLHPNQLIPPFISNLTGIVNEDVQHAPTFAQIASKIIDYFDNSYLVAHNVPFDLGFLNEELLNNNFEQLMNPVIDTVELARIFFPEAPGYSLAQLTEHFNIHHKNPHRALSDAYVTGTIFLKIIEKINELPVETINHLLRLENKFSSDLYNILYDRLTYLTTQTSYQTDLITYNGLTFNNSPLKQINKTELTMSFGTFLDDIYEEKGSMQTKMAQFEQRPGQREMSEIIYDAFESSDHALIEAGTGTGKSIAYLLPAIYNSLATNKRIVISTHTISLQSQLLLEDIPLAEKLIPFPVQSTILKGKSNYLSLEKFHESLVNDHADNYEVALTKAMILIWITETESGDLDEIQLSPGGYSFFKSISAASEEKVDSQSPWFYYSYYRHARKKAEQANIIITNHALLCTDMLNNYKLIPTYDKAIIDEAHHLETTASRQFGLQLNYKNLQFKLNQLGSSSTGSWISKVNKVYKEINNTPILKEWSNTFEQVKYEVDEFFQLLFNYVKHKKGKQPVSDLGKIQYRYEEAKENQNEWQVIKEVANRLITFLDDLRKTLLNLESYLETTEENSKHYLDDLITHQQTLLSFIERLQKLFIYNEMNDRVNWIELDIYGTNNSIYIYSEPMHVANILTETYFTKKSSVILTSATLTMRNSFSFITDRLGLDSETVLTKQIKSPFSYDDQVQVLVPNDFPELHAHDLDDYVYSTCEAILSLAKVTDGRMLVLFTSYDMLRRCHFILREMIDTDKYFLIAQGISTGSRTRLKKDFQAFERSILLGTSSFWEGIDIPGEDLSCLVIARLPFKRPNDPVYEAKANDLKQAGKNPFIDYALPKAVIRFKQGFGRLIRSKTDRGIIFICDARIVQARYGKFFTDSIPNVPISYESTYSLVEKAEKWF